MRTESAPRIAVIPCHNEAHCISRIITETGKHVDEVIVVDNNSTDRTSDVARLAGATVLLCRVRGAGAATKYGVKWALGRRAEIIVTLDGDGQHDASEIPLVIAPIAAGILDVSIGSRFLSKSESIPSYRKAGIEIINALYNCGHHPICDSQSGFRAFTAEVAEKCWISEPGFGFSTEFLIKARKAGFEIGEVAVRCIYHADRQKNHTLNPVRHGLTAAMKTVAWRLREWN